MVCLTYPLLVAVVNVDFVSITLDDSYSYMNKPVILLHAFDHTYWKIVHCIYFLFEPHL